MKILTFLRRVIQEQNRNGETLSLAWNLIQKRQGEGDDAGAFSGLCLLT